MKPSFVDGYKTYTRNREFTVTEISGWVKNHYTPDEPDLLGHENDCFVYTAVDKKQLFIVTIDRDEVSITFSLTEQSVASSRPYSIIEAIKKELELNAKDELNVYLVDNLPAETMPDKNAYYLVRAQNQYTLYFANAAHHYFTQVNSASSDVSEFNENINLLANAVESGDEDKITELLELVKEQSDFHSKTYWWSYRPDYLNAEDETVPTIFKSLNNAAKYDNLCKALEIFQRHCEIPVEVITDISSIIKGKKDSFLEDRINLAQNISDDPVSARMKIAAILDNGNIYGDSEHVLNLANWYVQNGNPDVAIFLCMSFPDSNQAFLTAHKLAIKYLLDDKSEIIKDGHYFEKLSTAAFKIAIRTNDEDDVSYAMRVNNELELNSGFVNHDLKSIEPDTLVDLLVAKSVEIRGLKEKLKIEAPAHSAGSSQSTAVSGSARLALSQNPERVSMQNIAFSTTKRDRRNSI